jgi:hypothetical protein
VTGEHWWVVIMLVSALWCLIRATAAFVKASRAKAPSLTEMKYRLSQGLPARPSPGIVVGIAWAVLGLFLGLIGAGMGNALREQGNAPAAPQTPTTTAPAKP